MAPWMAQQKITSGGLMGLLCLCRQSHWWQAKNIQSSKSPWVVNDNGEIQEVHLTWSGICCKSTFESEHIICKHVNISIYYHLFNIQPMRIFCKYAFCGSSCPHRHPYLRRKPSIVLHSQAPLVGFKAPVAQSIWVWRYLKPCLDKSWWNDIEMTQQPALVMHRHLPGFHW